MEDEFMVINQITYSILSPLHTKFLLTKKWNCAYPCWEQFMSLQSCVCHAKHWMGILHGILAIKLFTDELKTFNKIGNGKFTGNPYVRKFMLNDRETAPRNKKSICLTPDLSQNCRSWNWFWRKDRKAMDWLDNRKTWLNKQLFW